MEENNIKDNILESTVVMDLGLMPKGMEVATWLKLMKEQGIILIDSFGREDFIKPYMLSPRRKMDYTVMEVDDYNKGI